MKKHILFFLFSIITLSAFGQAGSLSQSVYRSRVNDSTAAIAANVAPIAAGYAPMFFNNQATTPHWDIWNGTAYDHVFDFNSGSGGGWVTTGVQTLTGPFGVESADSIGFASSSGINLRGGSDAVSSVMTGDPDNLNYAQTGVYRDATFGNYAFLAAASTGASVIARVDVQSWPGGESSADINADTIHLSLDEVNVLKVVPSGAWQVGASEDPGTSGYVLQSNGAGAAPTWVANSVALVIDIGDETTAVVSGTGVRTFRMPYAMTVTEVRSNLKTAQASGSTFMVDINENGTSILSTKLTIDNTEKTSTTAATPPVISDTTLGDDSEITIDIDLAGTGGVGPKITLIGRRL